MFPSKEHRPNPVFAPLALSHGMRGKKQHLATRQAMSDAFCALDPG
jgi:hypothetical protein